MNIKKWLKDNKIYFETLMTVSLSFMGLFVSICSVTIQKDANELQEKQAIITEQLDMPIFNCTYTYYESYVDNGISYPNGNEINILNCGGNISGGYLYAETQIEVYVYDEHERRGVIVINDLGGYPKKFSYYDAQNKSFTIRKNNETRNLELCKYIDKQLTNKYEMCSFTASYLDYVNLQYTDFQNKLHSEWYELSREKLSKQTPTNSEQSVTLPLETMSDSEICLVIEEMVDDMLKDN
mgnify:CR=1 FL=1